MVVFFYQTLNKLAQCLKKLNEKSTCNNCSNALYSDFFYFLKQKPRSQQGRLRTGFWCYYFIFLFIISPAAVSVYRALFDMGANLIVYYWAPLRYLFRKKTSEPRRLPALFTVTHVNGAFTRLTPHKRSKTQYFT